MIRYIAIVPTSAENSIRVETGYYGGRNWWNGETERRGYYLYCSPCKVETRQDSNGRTYQTFKYELGSGRKLLLKEVTRRSKKAEAEAEQIALEKVDWFVNQFAKRYGLKIIGMVNAENEK